jgi:hypothetical protein
MTYIEGFLSRQEGSIAVMVKDDYSRAALLFPLPFPHSSSASKCNLASNQSYQELERAMGEMTLLICSSGI